MGEENSKKGWGLGLGKIARLIMERGKSSAPDPVEECRSAEAVSVEGCLRVTMNEGKRLDFYSTLSSQRMFAVGGMLIGPLGKFTKESGGGKQVTITAPVRLIDGTKCTVKVVFSAPRDNPSSGDLKLIRAGQGIVPPDARVLEFLYSRAKCELRYVVELPSSVEIIGFSEVLDRRPLFSTVPPVAQMSAFLRAVTRKRRSVLSVLDSLRDVSSVETLACVEALRDACEERGDDEVINVEVPVKLREALKAAGKVISERVIAAFSLFADMETGALTVDSLQESGSVSVTSPSAYLVAQHLGLNQGEDEWREVLNDANFDLSKTMSVVKSFAYATVVGKLAGQWDGRTPVQTLWQVASESGSQRVVAFAEKLKSRLVDGRLSINDQQLALLAVLSAVGRRYHANTVVALCLFVDVEVGYITESILDQLSPSSDTIDTSTYAMLAVAGAFDVDLRGFVLECNGIEELSVAFPRLVELAGVGLLGGFRRKVEGTPVWHWLRTSKAAVKALSSPGVEFSNTVLGSFPILDQLSEIDLSFIVSSGRDFVAAFQSDLDKSLLWRRLSDIPEDTFRSPCDEDGVRRSFSFIDGFSAYHFSRAIFGTISSVTDEELIGADDVLGVYLDDRENRHYRYRAHVEKLSDLDAEPNAGLVFNHQVVDRLDVSRMPGKTRELSQDALLGRSNEMSAEYRVLGWINKALWEVLTGKPSYLNLTSVPNIYTRLHKVLFEGGGRRLIEGLADERTLSITARALRTGCETLEFRTFAPMLEGDASNEQLQYIGLRIIYKIIVEELLDFEGYFKQVDVKMFNKLLEERLTALSGSRNDSSRRMALYAGGTSEVSGTHDSRFATQYLLVTGLQDSVDSVGQAAATSLVRLCLHDKVQLPHMLDCIRLAKPIVQEKVVPDKVKVEEKRQDEVHLPPGEIKRFERAVDEWMKFVKNSSPSRFNDLPFTNDDGEVDRVRLQSFAEFVVTINEASRDEEHHFPRRYFVIVRNRDLEQVRGAMLESWRLMAQSMRRRLADIIAEGTAPEVFLDYRFFVEDNDVELCRELGARPYLGGEANDLTVYHFRPGEAVGPFRHLDSSFVKDVREESKFFLELLKMYFESSEGHVRIVRIFSASGIRMEEIESHLPVFHLERPVDLRLAEVLQVHRKRFSPIVHDLAFSLEQIGSDPKDIEDVQALLCLYSGKRWQKTQPGSGALTPRALERAEKARNQREEDGRASREKSSSGEIPAVAYAAGAPNIEVESGKENGATPATLASPQSSMAAAESQSAGTASGSGVAMVSGTAPASEAGTSGGTAMVSGTATTDSGHNVEGGDDATPVTVAVTSDASESGASENKGGKPLLTLERLPELAHSIGRNFSTPPELDRQIENMLIMVLRRSTYDI